MDRRDVLRTTGAGGPVPRRRRAVPTGRPASPGSVALALVVGVLLALLAGCGDGNSAGPAEGASARSTAPVEIAVTVSRGRVTPATERVDVARGSLVRITVATDVADEIHVHGYELSKELPARGAATIEFVADRTGLFEVETHKAGLVICQLLVR